MEAPNNPGPGGSGDREPDDIPDIFNGRIRTTRLIGKPCIVPMSRGSHDFKILMRRVEMDPECLIWEVRLYRGKGNNQPGWEPSDDEDKESNSEMLSQQRNLHPFIKKSLGFCQPVINVPLSKDQDFEKEIDYDIIRNCGRVIVKKEEPGDSNIKWKVDPPKTYGKRSFSEMSDSDEDEYPFA